MQRKWLARAIATTAAAAIPSMWAISSFAAAPLASSQAGQDGSRSSAAGVAGVVTVSESKSDPANPSWSALSVADTAVIGQDRNGWSGAGASAGSQVDALNAKLCPDGRTVAGTTISACAVLLPSAVEGNLTPEVRYGSAQGMIAAAAVGAERDGETYLVEARVLPSYAYENSSTCDSTQAEASLLLLSTTPGNPHDRVDTPVGTETSRYFVCPA